MIGSAAIAARQRTARAARVQLEALAAGRLCREISRPELFELGDDWREVLRPPPRQPEVDIKQPQDQPVVTARLPELHGLIDQIRPWYTKDTIDGLLRILAAAEARLTGA
jgi:hypothetical protein